MFKYAMKNLRILKKNEFTIYWVVIICVFVSSVMIAFSYGIYRNYVSENEANNPILTELQVIFLNGNEKKITKEKLDKCLLKFSKNLNDKIECFFIEIEIENNIFTECRFTIKNEKFSVCEVFKENMIKGNFLEKYFTQEQEEMGQAVAFIYDKQNYRDFKLKMNNKNEYIDFQGKLFKIIGTQNWLIDSVLVPYAALDKNTILSESGITMLFSNAITEEQYKEISKLFIDEFGNNISIPPMQKSNITKEDINNTMIILSTLISGIAAINITILLLYVFTTRKRQFGIFLICGLRKYQIIKLYFLESIILCVPVFSIGIIVYQWIIFPLLKQYYTFIENIYSIKTYILMFLIYFIVTFIVLIVVIIRYIKKNTIKDLLVVIK